MELAVRPRRSIRKQSKFNDYASPKVAATLSFEGMVQAELNNGEGDVNKSQMQPTVAVTLSCQSVVQVNMNDRQDASNKSQLPPQTLKINEQHAAKTPKQNPLMARIQRDLNSPSASVRLRALKAMRSPTKRAYAQFDISHTEKSIITADERQQAAKTPPTLREILKDIVLYVEVRTDDDDRSAGVKKVIAALGARVNDNLKRDTTHVIFKDGRFSTFKKAKSLGIPIVSILWIEACKNKRRICDPKDYQISNLDRYENPELYGKMKRHKFIQPGAEDRRRCRKKQAIEPTPPKTNSSLFKMLEKTGSSIVTPIISNRAVDSPATVLLKRYTSNQYTPIASVGKTKSLCKNHVETTPVTTQRRSASNNDIANTTDSIAEMSISQLTPPSSRQFLEGQTADEQRRSTLLPIANSTRISYFLENCNDKQSNEEVIPESSPTDEAFIVPVTARRQTSVTSKPMEITVCQNENSKAVNMIEVSVQLSTRRRRTLYTPHTMVECSRFNGNPSVASVSSSTTQLETFDVQSMVEVVAIVTTPPCPQNDGMENIDTESFGDKNFASAPRRTLYDLPMDVSSHQAQDINAESCQSLTMTPSAKEMALEPLNADNNENECNVSLQAIGNPNGTQTAQVDAPNNVSTALEKRKRKLFRPPALSLLTTPPVTPSKITRDSPRSSNSNTPTKRRRTLMPSVVNKNVVDAAPSLPPANKILPKAALPTRRSTLDFEAPPKPPLVERKKPKSKSKQLAPVTTVSRSTLKEKDVNIVKKSSQKAVSNLKTVAQTKPITRLPFLAFTNMRAEQIAVINEAVEKLGGFIVEHTVGTHTTHMVSLEPRRTMNILRALIRGLWILDYTWIVDSLKAGHWLNEEQYELKDFSRAVEICRAERQAFGQCKCELFADLGAFFVSSRCQNVTARDLKQLIRMCGGNVVDQREKAKYIISSSTGATDDKIYVTPLWILDSITKMQILRVKKYATTASQLTQTQCAQAGTQNMATVVDVVKA